MRIRTELYFLETFINGGCCEGKWECLAPRSKPTQWLIQMSNKEKAVPRIAGHKQLPSRAPFPARKRPEGQMPGSGPALRPEGPVGRPEGWWSPPPLLGMPALMLTSHRASGELLNLTCLSFLIWKIGITTPTTRVVRKITGVQT